MPAGAEFSLVALDGPAEAVCTFPVGGTALLDGERADAWSRYAHALARTDRVSDAIAAAERALMLAPEDEEVAVLLERLHAAQPRVLPAA